jgi:O-antigen ligase
MNQALESENISSIVRRHWGLFLFVSCVFFFSHPFDIFSSIGGDLMAEEIIEATQRGNVARQVALSMLGIWSIATILRSCRIPGGRKKVLSLLIVLFLAVAFCSVAWAEDKLLTVRKLVVLLALSLGTFAFASRLSFREINVFAFFCSGLILLMGVLCEMGLGTLHPFAGEYRFSGGLHPNAQGVNCAILSIASIGLGQLDKRHRIAFYAAGIIALSFLIMTKSRTAFASVILSLVVYWVFLSRPRTRVTFLFIATICSISLYLILGNTLIDYVKNTLLIGRTPFSSLSLTGRVPLWEECLRYLAQRPLLGYGYNAFWTPKHVWAISRVLEWGVGVAHSGYLEVALGTGIVGAGIYICLFLLAILRIIIIFRTSREVTYLFALAVLLLFCACSFLESWVAAVSLSHFTVLTIVARLGFFETA